MNASDDKAVNWSEKGANNDPTAEDVARNASESNQIHAEVYRARSKPPDRRNFKNGKEYIAAMSFQLFEMLDMSKTVLMSSASKRQYDSQKDIGTSTVRWPHLLHLH